MDDYIECVCGEIIKIIKYQCPVQCSKCNDFYIYDEEKERYVRSRSCESGVEKSY